MRARICERVLGVRATLIWNLGYADAIAITSDSLLLLATA